MGARLVLDARDQAVVYATAERMWAETTCERLAELRPDVYAGWRPRELSAALKPYGLRPTDTWGRLPDGTGANRKGLTREAVMAAIDAHRRPQLNQAATDHPIRVGADEGKRSWSDRSPPAMCSPPSTNARTRPRSTAVVVDEDVPGSCPVDDPSGLACCGRPEDDDQGHELPPGGPLSSAVGSPPYA